MIKINDTKVVRIEGKKLTIPMVLPFSNYKLVSPNFCEYEVIGFREPKKGEWYLSGAIIETHQAPNDLSGKYWVVKPTVQKKLKNITIFIDK